jgi:hypothetical protein
VDDEEPGFDEELPIDEGEEEEFFEE